MLLGHGTCLDFRRKVRRELRNKGYNVMIMEDDKETKNEARLDVKFEKIMNRYEPVFVAFFLKGAKSMEGVIFEIGCICCKYGCERLGDRLMLLSNKKYDWDRRTAYISNLLPRVIKDEFDETKRHHKASERIHLFAAGYIAHIWSASHDA
jgi:hypothetical protein